MKTNKANLPISQILIIMLLLLKKTRNRLTKTLALLNTTSIIRKVTTLISILVKS